MAARWIVDAGFALESIVPDGYGSIPKAERTGCHVDDLPAIVAYKDAYYVNRKAARRMGCRRLTVLLPLRMWRATAGCMNWTVYIESLGERPSMLTKPTSDRCPRA